MNRAARTTATVYGVIVGLAGMEHGYFVLTPILGLARDSLQPDPSTERP